MLSENKNNSNKFDKFLKDSLKQYCQPAPAGFPEQMLNKLEQFRQQKALRQIIRQERILLAALILLPAAVVILVLVFPNLLLVSSQLPAMLPLLAKTVAANIIQRWQLWLNYAAIAAVMIYAVHEMLLADN